MLWCCFCLCTPKRSFWGKNWIFSGTNVKYMYMYIVIPSKLSSVSLNFSHHIHNVIINHIHYKEKFILLQMIQAKMANMYTTLNASRSYVYNVARSLDRGERQNNVRHSESMNLSLKTTKYINILVCTFPGIVVHSYFVGRVYILWL